MSANYYGAVAPPSQGAPDAQSAFADALARARQIAAKIGQPGEETGGHKRPFEGSSDSQPDPKKVASNDNSAIEAQLRAIADQQRQSAVQAAAAAASQINQKLGAGNMNPSNPGMGGMGGGHAGLGAVVNVEWTVPDKMVGLIIGKGGEQIASIQAETGCKIQFAQDSGGMPERPCTLTGSQEAIASAKDMIGKIVSRAQGMGDGMGGMDGGHMGGMNDGSRVEIMIPGNKVGLVIGKGGETIRQLQERAGVKMVMIQDSNQPSAHDKALRITGEPSKCQRARDMVMDLITEKEIESMQHGGFGNDFGPGGGPGKTSTEIRVPRPAVGVIIGKGGDMIKKIQQESGARVQFTPDDGHSQDRTCSITGPADRVQQAVNMIQDLIQSTANGPMGRGRGRGRGDGGGRFGDRGPGGPPGRGRGPYNDGAPDFDDATTFGVPSDKCGLVIGKGGETIRQINQQSGAHVELQRAPGPNPGEKVFSIRGNPGQIQHAIQLISEKAGIPSPQSGPGGGPGGPGPGGPGGPGGPNGPGPGGPGGYDQYGQSTQYPMQYGQSQPPQQQPPQSFAPQGWGNAYQQYQNQNPSEPNKQAADANAAAWQAYYAQFYNQGGQQQAAPQQQPPQQPPAAPPQQQTQAQPSPAINPATGQLDYSAAWVEYYRAQGMHYQAQAILAQQGGGQPGPAPQ